MKVFLSVLASLLLASPDVPVVSGAAVAPPVVVVLSTVNVPGVLAVARVFTLLLLTLEVTAVASVPFVVNMPYASGVSNSPDTPAVVGVLCCSICHLCCCWACCCCFFLGFPAVNRVSAVAASLLMLSSLPRIMCRN